MVQVDYVVVGAGSAGCVLANRLSADPKNRVLLLEAGPEDKNVWIHVPLGYGRNIDNPAVNSARRSAGTVIGREVTRSTFGTGGRRR